MRGECYGRTPLPQRTLVTRDVLSGPRSSAFAGRFSIQYTQNSYQVLFILCRYLVNFSSSVVSFSGFPLVLSGRYYSRWFS